MVEIVRTADVLGGFPRLEGRRIGVHHVLGTLETCGDESEAADRLKISTEAVQTAVAYAESHPDVMAEVERERAESLNRVREGVEYPEGVEPPGNRNSERSTATVRKPAVEISQSQPGDGRCSYSSISSMVTGRSSALGSSKSAAS